MLINLTFITATTKYRAVFFNLLLQTILPVRDVIE